MGHLGEMLHGGPVTADDVAILQHKLLFDRVPVRDRFVRFFALVFLSAVIASYGVVSDSTAVVIGAMIVAPMMTPIMAISLAVVSGDSKNIVRSFLIAVAGTALVVGSSLLLAGILPGSLSVTGNSQVASRTAPRMIDLVIALAAGAAGAFATSREDVSDALPGVAIAVSLVPPLAVVGVALSARQMGDAWGALLLFLTNFLAIVAAGLIVFAVMGYGGASMGGKKRKARRVAIAAVVIATLLITIPLGMTGYRVTSTENLRRRAQASVDRWLEGTDYQVAKVEADAGSVEVIIAGDDPLPDLDELLADLGERAPGVRVTVDVVPRKRLKGETGT
jgi:uncharacterized hydrophobic protein (TIGR00271 family)